VNPKTLSPEFKARFGEKGPVRLAIRCLTELTFPGLRDHHDEQLLEYMRHHRVPTKYGNYSWLYNHNLGVASDTRLLLAEFRESNQNDHEIVVAAKFHDVGKTEIPEDILYSKDLRSFPDKWAIMMTHPVIGAHIFRQFLPSYWRGPKLIRHHHEAWGENITDGYPDHLHKRAIPFGSQVIAIADKGLACREPRPWQGGRIPKTIDQAIDYMEGQKAKGEVNPEIAEAWIQLAKHHRLTPLR
jgi:response regulator RpfG family c-di-GMP phosphodiesterase